MSDNDIKLSRRKVLAGLGTIGVASAGAGLGTTAWLSDEESFLDNVFTAGTLDLTVRYWRYVDQDGSGPSHGGQGGTNNGGDVSNGGEPISIDIDDVKPGDWGSIKFCFDIVDNPAYLWACGTLTESAENGYTEPEPVDDNGEGELDDAINATAYYCHEQNGSAVDDPADIPAESVIASGTLGDVVQGLEYGLPLDGDGNTQNGVREPYEAGVENPNNPCVCIYWEVPTTVGNEIQGDSLSFDVVFNAVQSRHNDGSHNPCCDCGPEEYAVTLPDGQVCCVTPFEGDSIEEFYAFEADESYEAGNDDLKAANTSTLTLFDDGSDLYLVVVHDDGENDGGGLASVVFSGSVTPNWVVKDDESDYYDGSGEAHWGWSPGKTDGGAAGIGSSGSSLDLTGTFAFNGDANDSGASVKNPNGSITSVRVLSATESSCSVDVDPAGETLDVVLSDDCPTTFDLQETQAD